MIEWAINQWNWNKEKLRKRLEATPQREYDSYDKLFKIVIDTIFNDENCYKHEPYSRVSIDDMTIIDYGDYSGTVIMVFHSSAYTPYLDEHYYTSMNYGSCSGCDTLLRISEYDEDIPTKQQVDDYMTLCLHMIQNMRQFEESDD